jgi:hypothetical protein
VNGYKGAERRKVSRLSNEEFHELAKEVKKLALDEIYADIGKGVLKRLLWLFGLGGSGAVAYLTMKGYIK